MHPNPRMRFAADAAADRAAMLAWAAARSFAHIFVGTPDGPMVAHAPITAAGPAFRFHVARGNRITRHLDGATVLLSLTDTDGYISPSWYADPRSATEVPTWNYLAVEIAGPARRLDDAELTAQLDALAAQNEPQVSPELPWTRAKTDPAHFDKLLRGIVGFEVAAESVRGTRKLSQNKTEADIVGVLAGLDRSGNRALADAMRP